MKIYNLTISMTDKTEEELLKQFNEKDVIKIFELLFNDKGLDVEVKPIEKPSTLIRNFVNDHLNQKE